MLTEDDVPLPDPIMPADGRFAGIDVGLTDFVVTNDGSHFQNPRHLRQMEKNLARKQRNWARKQKGSRLRDKARRVGARCHERVKNARKDDLHKLSRKLVDESQTIAVEDLNLKRMVRHPNLAEAIADAGWGMFTRFCQYNADKTGKYS